MIFFNISFCAANNRDGHAVAGWTRGCRSMLLTNCEINGHKQMTSPPASQRRCVAQQPVTKNNCEPRTTTGGRVFISLRAQMHFPKASSIGGSANQMRRTLKTWILGLDEFSSSSIQHLNSSHSETQQQLQRKTNKRCWQTESCVL